MQNKKTTKIFIIAGEVSGDVLGANIMAQMPDADFIGIGGENMCKHGLISLFPMSDLSVMGIIEVLAHIKTLKSRIKQTINAIIESKPDIVLTIDSPGFAKSVISGIRKNKIGINLINNGMRFHHVVAPQVWAWRPKRAKKYAKIFDKLYAFFDFELPYFTKYGLSAVAVGHPISDNIIGKYDIKNTKKKIITLIPGSRMNEVKKLLPIYHDFIKILTQNSSKNNYEFYIPTVETTDKYIKASISGWDIKPKVINSEKRYELYEKTYIAIVASGTVSAELAMMHIPTIVVYKMNFFTTFLAKILINIQWVSLVNILLNRSVYPELLGPNATAQNIYIEFQKLTNKKTRDFMISELHNADTMWRKNNAPIAKQIANQIKSCE